MKIKRGLNTINSLTSFRSRNYLHLMNEQSQTHAGMNCSSHILYRYNDASLSRYIQSGVTRCLSCRWISFQVASLKDLFEQASVNAISIYAIVCPYNGSTKCVAIYEEISTIVKNTQSFNNLLMQKTRFHALYSPKLSAGEEKKDSGRRVQFNADYGY